MPQDYSNLKRMLKGLVDEKRQQKIDEESTRKTKNDEDRNHLLGSVVKDLQESLKPVIADLAKNSRVTAAELKEAIKEAIQVNIPEINIPEINIPEIRMPEIKMPAVNIPAIRIPDIKMPDEMNIKGWVNLMGYDKGFLDNPLPVQLRDADGKPVNLSMMTNVMTGGGGGGKSDFFTIKGFSQSAYSELMNADGRLRVSLETGGSGLTDNELRAAHLDVLQMSGSVDSVYVLGAFGSTIADGVFNADNRIRVSVETGGSGLTDAELRASRIPVEQVSGAIWSVYVSGSVNTAVTILNGDGVYRDTFPVSGTVAVSGITNSVAASLVDSSGVQYSGSNPVPVTGAVTVLGAISSTGAYLLDGDGNYRNTMPISGTVAVSGITNSVAASIIDSSGLQYSGSNPFPVSVSGSISSVVAVGAVVADGIDDGSAPVQTGAIARTANPTAVSGGDVVKLTADDLGRQVMRPVQVRDLIATAYATLSNGTETTLLSASAGVYHDLIYVMGANNSDVAVTVDVRGVTAGNVVMTLQVPANGTAGIACPVPLPQAETGNNWTADMGDITGTSVYLTALFSKEI